MPWLRPVLLVSGLAALVGVLLVPELRRPDGGWRSEAWTLAILGGSLVGAGAAWRTSWQRAGALLALAVAGQACALGLRHSPPYNVLEHYHRWSEIWGTPRMWLLLGPLAQGVVVARAALHAGAPRLRRLLDARQLAAVAAVAGFAAANGSQDVARYLGELALAGFILVVNLGNLLLVAAAMPEAVSATVWQRLVGWADDGRACARARAGIALWVVAASAALSWFVLEGIPHVPDSASYLFHARYFAEGRLALPAPPDAASFSIHQTVIADGRWYGYGSPGFPAVLSLGVRAGAPWLVNPLLSGLLVLLGTSLVRRLHGPRIALATGLLLAVSPWFLFMGASFLTHPLSALLTVATLLCLVRGREGRAAGWAFLAGSCMGALFLTRPLDALLVALPIGLWCLGWGAPRLGWRSLAAAAAAGLLVASLAFPYNRALTGSATVFPIDVFTDATNAPGADRVGFGPHIGNRNWPHLDPLPGHGPLDVVINANQNLYMTSFELFGWSFGSLGFVMLGVLLGRSWRRPDGLWLGIAAGVAGGHGFYWFSGGPDFGARYWYQCLFPLVVLTATGIRATQRRWSELGGAPRQLATFVVAASLAAVVNVVPARVTGKYHHYRGFRADAGELARRPELRDALVFVRAGHKSDYASAALFNPVPLDAGGPIFARLLDPETRERVERAFPDRSVWLVEGAREPEDAFLEGSFTVLEGPLPAWNARAR